MVHYLFNCFASSNTFNCSFVSCYVLNCLSIAHMSILENVFLYSIFLTDMRQMGDVVSDVAKLIRILWDMLCLQMLPHHILYNSVEKHHAFAVHDNIS